MLEKELFHSCPHFNKCGHELSKQKHVSERCRPIGTSDGIVECWNADNQRLEENFCVVRVYPGFLTGNLLRARNPWADGQIADIKRFARTVFLIYFNTPSSVVLCKTLDLTQFARSRYEGR